MYSTALSWYLQFTQQCRFFFYFHCLDLHLLTSSYPKISLNSQQFAKIVCLWVTQNVPYYVHLLRHGVTNLSNSWIFSLHNGMTKRILKPFSIDWTLIFIRETPKTIFFKSALPKWLSAVPYYCTLYSTGILTWSFLYVFVILLPYDFWLFRFLYCCFH